MIEKTIRICAIIFTLLCLYACEIKHDVSNIKKEVVSFLSESRVYLPSATVLFLEKDTVAITLIDTSKSFVSEFAHLNAIVLINRLYSKGVEERVVKINYELSSLNYVYPAIYPAEKCKKIRETMKRSPRLEKGSKVFSTRFNAQEAAYFTSAIEVLEEKYDFFKFKGNSTDFLVKLMEAGSATNENNICNELEALARLFEGTRSTNLFEVSKIIREISLCPPMTKPTQ